MGGTKKTEEGAGRRAEGTGRIYGGDGCRKGAKRKGGGRQERGSGDEAGLGRLRGGNGWGALGFAREFRGWRWVRGWKKAWDGDGGYIYKGGMDRRTASQRGL
ncbi:hypothetical protein Tco_0915238 [Tanacetum coccineum]